MQIWSGHFKCLCFCLGDVILSINGTDVEKADHKDLVGFIQNSTRLRMVVLYEDCARRVDLHMRYITLTQKLQYAVSEFKQLCKKEKQLLFGKRKSRIVQTFNDDFFFQI